MLFSQTKKILPVMTSEIEQSFVQVNCSNWRDTLRLKICGMLRRLLSSDGKEERQYKVKSASTSFEKNNSTRRQENVMLPSYSLWIEERGKNTHHNKTWVNASDTVFRRNHEPQHANGKQVFFSRLSDRESQLPGVNHTLSKCCFVHRWLIISLVSEAFWAAT